MNIKLVLQILIGIAGYSTWAVMAYCDQSLRSNFLNFNIGMAMGTIGLALRDMKAADSSAPPADKQGGYASVAMLLTLASVVLMLGGCSLMSANMNAFEEGMAQTVVQSSERTICRDIPIGTWLRLYGTNSDRLKGWQALCFNPVKAPLNDQTVAAILKIYPGFQQAVETSPAPGEELPSVPAASPTSAPVLPAVELK